VQGFILYKIITQGIINGVVILKHLKKQIQTKYNQNMKRHTHTNITKYIHSIKKNKWGKAKVDLIGNKTKYRKTIW